MVRSHSFAWILGSLLLLALAAPLQAAITPSGDVDPTDYSWWIGGGSYLTDAYAYIGKTGTGSVLVDLGSRLRSDYGYIGDEAGALGEVTVDGSGSGWHSVNWLYVGNYGHGTLNITNGGGVVSYTGYIGYEAGSRGLVTVDGGSNWSNQGKLYVGSYGQGILNITNGGVVFSHTGYIGYVSRGLVTVDGGSRWNNDATLYIGVQGQGTLKITDGGVVSSDTGGYIGEEAGSTGLVTVDGNGSSWINDGSLLVGYFGQGTLNITHGGAVRNTNGYIGEMAGSVGVVTVSVSGSTWNNSGRLEIGSSGDGTLNIINGGVVVSNSYGYIGRMVGSTGLVTVAGRGSAWTNPDNTNGGRDLTVGDYGQGTLNIANHGSVDTGAGSIGKEAGSTGVVTVDGGSTWTNSADLYVGDYGHGTLDITNGGAVSSADGYIGEMPGSVGVVTVDGGSTWTDIGSWSYSGWLYVGNSGHGILNITNVGVVVSNIGLIGNKAGALGEVTVDGIDSAWNNSSELDVGVFGHGRLTITNDGAVSSDSGYIGFGSESTGVVTVDGSGSTWNNSGRLTVGISGHGTLNITGGGTVSSVDCYIGHEDGATGVVTVADSGSSWSASDNLYVGGNLYSNGGTGELHITRGGTVSNSYGLIGYRADSTGVVTVSGSGSTWNNGDWLQVGNYGQGTLEITNGGAVSNTDGYIGYRAGSTGVVTVESGSTWNNFGLYVGGNSYSSGGMGELHITSGGTVSNSYGYIGYGSGSTGLVTVAGSGSLLTNGAWLSVGESGYGTLNITDGGIVEVGGTLNVGGRGTLNIGATGTVAVGEALVLAQDSTLTADAGAVIHMAGSAFRNESTNSADLAGLGDLTLIFEGGAGIIDPFEVAGKDMGAVIAGYDDNFALGTLQLGGGTDIGQVQLVDDVDNQRRWVGSEALYTNILTVNADSILYLNGFNIYYYRGQIDGAVNDGELIPIDWIKGDANWDVSVDDSDLSLLLTGWATGTIWQEGDFDGDGDVDDSDLSLLLTNWTYPLASAAVPEPATMLLLAIGGLAILKRKA